MREECLEHIWDCKLRSRCRPFIWMLSVLLGNISVLIFTPFRICILCDQDGIIDETHFFVGRFVFENITVLFRIVTAELDDLLRCIRNLDRVCFDVCDCESARLHLIPEVDHEQSTTFCDDVVYITLVTERIVELCRGETINRVNDRFQCQCQIICRHLASLNHIDGFVQTTIQHGSSLIKLSMLYGNTSVFDLFKALRIDQTKQLFRNDRTRMHRRNVQNHNLPVYTRFSVDIATFANRLLIGIRVECIHIPIGRFPIFIFVSGKYGPIQIIKEVVLIAC